MLRLYQYRLPFQKPFKTAAGEFNHRRGIILHYRKGEIDLISEAAPLPGFSSESFNDVKETLVNRRDEIGENLGRIENLSDLWDGLAGTVGELPSIQFSVTFLGAAILAHQSGKSLFDLFGRSIKPKVHLNAVAGTLPTEELKRQILLSVKQGFRVIKLKASKNTDQLIPVLEAVSKQEPNIQFRLDANRSWPIDEIRDRTSAFSHLPIEYVEEPSKFRGDEELEQMVRESRLPIALDESVQNTEQLNNLMGSCPEVTFIIKPMLYGNLIRLFETIQSNRSLFRQIIVTTTLESAVGRSMIAVCTALFGDPNRGHGLRTGTIFERDILPDPTDQPILDSEFFSMPAYRRFSSADISQLEPL